MNFSATKYSTSDCTCDKLFGLDLGWIWIAGFLVGICLALLILIRVFGSVGFWWVVGSCGGMVVVTGMWVLCVVVKERDGGEEIEIELFYFIG